MNKLNREGFGVTISIDTGEKKIGKGRDEERLLGETFVQQWGHDRLVKKNRMILRKVWEIPALDLIQGKNLYSNISTEFASFYD